MITRTAKAQLLAAEFLENPFSQPFAEAEAKIREKQFAASPVDEKALAQTNLFLQMSGHPCRLRLLGKAQHRP